MSQQNIPTTANARVRSAINAPDAENCALVAPVAAFTFFHPFTSTDITAGMTPIVNENLTGLRHATLSSPDAKITEGTLDGNFDADYIPPIVTAMEGVENPAGVEDPPGVFTHVYAQSHAAANRVGPNYSLEIERGDLEPEMTVGVTPEFTLTLAEAALATLSIGFTGVYSTRWKLGAETHPSPAIGATLAQGLAEGHITRPDDIRDLYARLLASDNPKRLVATALLGTPALLSGTWSPASASLTILGSGGAALSEIAADDVIQFGTLGDGGAFEQFLEIDRVVDDDTILVKVLPNDSDPGVQAFREYGGADVGIEVGPYDEFDVIPGISPDGSLPVWNEIKYSKGGFGLVRAESGQGVRVHFTTGSGIPTVVPVALADTITVVAGDQTTTGGGSSVFLSTVMVGSLITTTGAAPQSRRVRRVISDTVLEMETSWKTSEGPVTANLTAIPTVTPAGGGTIATTAGSNALVGTSTAFDVDYSVGSWIWLGDASAREERRVLVITDPTNMTVSVALDNTVAAADHVTDFEWRYGWLLDPWVSTIHTSGSFPEILTKSEYLLRVPGEVEPLKFELLRTATMAWTTGFGGTTGTGEDGQPLVSILTRSSATISLTARNLTTRWRRLVEGAQRLRFDTRMLSGVKIPGGSGYPEFEWRWVMQLRATGTKPLVVVDEETNDAVIEAELFANPDDLDFPDPLTLVIVSDRDDPTFTIKHAGT